jgi:DNA-binding LacI/PurR family transcriptional regulator
MNDRALPGLMQALADAGRRVPDDFSVIATVSSSRATEMMVPPMTTTDVPSAELGRLGVEHLVRRIEGGSTETTGQLIPCQLSVRGSTGPCRTRPRRKEVAFRTAATGTAVRSRSEIPK